MIISFQLTMPNRSSWNGKWSGDEKKFYVIRSIPKRFITKNEHLKTVLEKGRDSWYYRWDDGWGANVCAEIIDATEAKKRRKVTAGFCGYGWMIDSILKIGKIKASHETEIA